MINMKSLLTLKDKAGAFETGGYRKAVLSFLKEKFPHLSKETEALSVHSGLKLVRKFIELKGAPKKSPPSAP